MTDSVGCPGSRQPSRIAAQPCPSPPSVCSGCDGGDRPVYSLQWAAAAGVPTEKDYPYPLPAATGICNPKVTKMKRAYTGGAVEVDLTSSQSLFKVCTAGY